MLSIVIPTLNAADTLGRTLAALSGARLPMEVIVADGGSHDFTRAVARKHGATMIEAPRGRGPQLAAGAKAAGGGWYLFLHADTVLAPDWPAHAESFMARPAHREAAGFFRFALDDRNAAARRLERAVAWRCRSLGLPYGDQGLLISRPFYESLGGFRPIPIMEDVDLVRRIGGGRLVEMNSTATTSAARYRQGGYLWRPVLNSACLGLYFLGLPPRLIARLYG